MLRVLTGSIVSLSLLTGSVFALDRSAACFQVVIPRDRVVCEDERLHSLDQKISAALTQHSAQYPEFKEAFATDQQRWLIESQCNVEQGREKISCLRLALSERLNEVRGKTYVVCAPPSTPPGSMYSRVVECVAPNFKHPLLLSLHGDSFDEGQAVLRKVDIRHGGGSIQEVPIKAMHEDDATYAVIWTNSMQFALTLVDINFDGHPDLKIETEQSAAPNMGYDYWIYDPVEEKYVASAAGDVLSGFDIIPDPKTKTIFTNGRSGC